MLGLFRVALTALVICCYANADDVTDLATFAVPFEISFKNVDQLKFNSFYSKWFIQATATYFSVETDNITIAFTRDLHMGDFIDVGFTINTNSFSEEYSIRKKGNEIKGYREFLYEEIQIPPIVGISPKYQSCPNGKYSTFYHYDIECQWLCNHLSCYNAHTNGCEPHPETPIITEENQPRFIIYGVITFVTLIIFYLIYCYCCRNSKEIKIKFQKMKTKYRKYATLLTPKTVNNKSTEFNYDDDEKDDDKNDNRDPNQINIEVVDNDEDTDKAKEINADEPGCEDADKAQNENADKPDHEPKAKQSKKHKNKHQPKAEKEDKTKNENEVEAQDKDKDKDEEDNLISNDAVTIC